MIRRLAGAALVAAAALPWAPAALAYLQYNLVDQGSPFIDIGLRLPGGSIVLRLEQDADSRITNGTDLTAIRDSMARWTSITTSNVTISEGLAFNYASPIDASIGIANDGASRVYFAATDNQNRLGSTTLAVSFVWFNPSTGGIVECDTIFNERYLFSTITPANPNQILGTSTYDLGEIATHEMGHCIGLDHSAVAGRFSATTGLQVSGYTSGDFTYQATIYPYGTRTIQGRSLHQDDISGASVIYANATLTGTTGTISGRVLDGGTFAKIKGAHVVAVSTAAPDIPIVGAHSDLQAGGPGGEYTLPGLPPGSYYLRLEPLVNTSNPYSADNSSFSWFDTGFPAEFYDGPTESGYDVASDRTAITLTAGQTVSGIDILTNVAAPDPNEPNGSIAAATPAGCERTIAGSIVPRGDIDYYAVPVTAPARLVADVRAARDGSPLDAIVAIFDASGARLGFADNGATLDPTLQVDLQVSGTYYVAVASYNDVNFTGSDARTAGNYTLVLSCTVPLVQAGTCPGRVLFGAVGADPRLVAIADADRDLHYEGMTTFAGLGAAPGGPIAMRRDGGVSVALGDVATLWDDNADFRSDRSVAASTGLLSGRSAVSFRHSGAEHLYVGDDWEGGIVRELLDTNGDALPERTTTFTEEPDLVYAMAIDEAGTLYVLDPAWNGGLGAILAFRDEDGDGAAERAWTYLDGSPSYAVLAARRPGEVYASDIFAGRIDRLRDTDGDGAADLVSPYASGLALDIAHGLAFDDADVLYSVDSGNRVVALPDADGDGAADAVVPFSPLVAGISWLTFGPGPPEEVSPPAARRPLAVAPAGAGLRLVFEDLGPTVPSYNVYEGRLGSPGSHAPLLCGVAGTSDGAGGRHLDVTPSDAGDHYYLVTASDACGEGTPGRDSDGRRRPLPAGACGAAP